MPITERLMASGQWGLQLDPGTPKLKTDLIDFFGHVYVFDTLQKPGQSDASMKSSSRWAGVVRRHQTPLDASGAGMITWLGDENGKGPLIEVAVTMAASTFATWVPALLPASVTAGTITAGGTTVANTYGGVAAGQTPLTPRQAIDNLAGICGFEYRVEKDATFNADVVGGTGLFVQTPTAVVMRRSSGRDQAVIGLSTTQLAVSIDAEEYITRSLVQSASGAWTGSTGAATGYKDLLGNLIVMTGPTVSSQTPNANAAALAANLVSAGQTLRNEITLSSDQFDITRDVKVGDWVYVYDVDSGMFDTTNQIHYRGSWIHPIKVRCTAITWPIERGMGVWYRDKAAVWTDLTPYVVFERPGASFEVGAGSRPILTKAILKL